MSIEPKYCKDCAYFYEPMRGGVALCSRYASQSKTVDLVRGPREIDNPGFCEHLRKDTGRCGLEGRGWAKREVPPKMLGQRDDSLFARIFGPWSA